MPYWELLYHLVWATKNREPLIIADLESELDKYLRGKGIEMGGIVHAVGGIEDHVHLAVSIPPRIAVATFVGQIKGASSHWVNHLSSHGGPFDWQDGYGALSFGKRSLPAVVRYVTSQRERHRTGRLIEGMERTESGSPELQLRGGRPFKPV
jgi:REP element-mobilizing transposase RayT